MSSRDIYDKATVYSPVDTRTKPPQNSNTSKKPSSSHAKVSSSNRPSSSAAPKAYTTLERDNKSTNKGLSQQHTLLQRDGQTSSSRGHTSSSHDRTQLNRDQQSSSSSRQPNMMHAATIAPPEAKSKFKSQHDVKMASQQARYQEMTYEEKKKQDEWVRNFIVYAGPCPAGFGWERVKHGYVCNGGNHLCTDDLLAEGKGGFYMGTLDAGWWGPIYDPEHRLRLDYADVIVWEYANKHGLNPTVAPVVPPPNIPATHEVHPGIAKALAGQGRMPRACSVEVVLEGFKRVGEFERLMGLLNNARSSHHVSGASSHHVSNAHRLSSGHHSSSAHRSSSGYHSSGVTPQLSTLYGPGGLPNRLAMSTSNGSVSQGGQLPLGYLPAAYRNDPSGQGQLRYRSH
ncbi:uncharacterized protein EAF01_008798 [Botrytis porri]|uniref:Uncharacterized protein n=1 Tax=Botrytis porri TaxID=87229 RepID=A0A4Z1KP04_9HELO|nr:uncharacterized protein EAF01_008798 [Botrytis porri]KAF7897832.1 hypothetical protein EAF01_008798 [Botrytis porri]TGO87116.1 hypothetical protein BPOR_0249g00060 [Botrytis porri]